MELLPIDRLYRYTTLPVLLDMLTKKAITFVNPKEWEDRNDARYLAQYRRNKQLETVLAVCFTGRPETFHHWKVFANGPSGVCIEFKQTQLLGDLKKTKGISFGPVNYKVVRDVKAAPPPVNSWPFTKRKPFDDEREYRVIYESANERAETKSVPFNLVAIRHITLSPWLPATITETIRGVIRKIEGCADFSITKSTVIDNLPWLLAINT